jgi:hypothetical protein
MTDVELAPEPELLAAEAARQSRASKKPKAVYAAIMAVSADIAKEGISKGRRNDQQNYAFRGIDDVMNALAPLLVKHNLLILPRCTARDVVERHTKSGSALFYVVVKVLFDFLCVTDGSVHVIEVYGEAMDSADKATNKAMSAAYKYACIQTFCIPTEGEDADKTTPDVAPLPAAAPAPLPTSKPWKTFTTTGATQARVAKPLTAVSEMAAAVIEGAVLITDVKPTKTRNPNVTRYIITDSNGEEHATIKETLAMEASQYKQTRTPVRLDTQGTQYGSELLHIRPLEMAALAVPGEGDDVPVYDDDTPPF